jgi:hypothetical protein
MGGGKIAGGIGVNAHTYQLTLMILEASARTHDQGQGINIYIPDPTAFLKSVTLSQSPKFLSSF